MCIRDRRTVAAINKIYRERPALWQKDTSPEGFTWIINNDGAGNTLAFTRWADDGSALVSITNFSPVVHENYALHLPQAGIWNEVLNTDDLNFGGSGVSNSVIHARAGESVTLRIPPLATIWLERRAG